MEKKIKIIFLVSVILIILGPVLGLSLDKITMVNQSYVISETSNADVQNATAYEFTLEKGQKVVIEFSVFTENVTANLIIMAKGDYDLAYEASTPPGSITGEKYFILSEFIFGYTTIGNLVYSDDICSITEEGYWYIEFAGATNGDYVKSIPGDYVVIVYGTNSGGPNLDIYFDLVIKIDGPGEVLETVFILIGLCAFVATMLFAAIGYLKKTARGLI